MSSPKAFTRVELCIVLASVAALAMWVLPALANNKARTEQVSCWNNLRQIGRAFHAWAADHENQNPWIAHVSKGGMNANNQSLTVPGIGTYPAGFANNAWFQFLWVYQELGTPQILVCPSDSQKSVAGNFLNFLPGGFAHANFQNRSLSYFVGVHATEETPYEFLSGDRHLRLDRTAVTTNCTYTSAAQFFAEVSTQADGVRVSPWDTNLLHRSSGNILRNDGTVEELSQEGLTKAFAAPWFRNDEGTTWHIMRP